MLVMPYIFQSTCRQFYRQTRQKCVSNAVMTRECRAYVVRMFLQMLCECYVDRCHVNVTRVLCASRADVTRMLHRRGALHMRDIRVANAM
jgi:hypothetical protein